MQLRECGRQDPLVDLVLLEEGPSAVGALLCQIGWARRGAEAEALLDDAVGAEELVGLDPQPVELPHRDALRRHGRQLEEEREDLAALELERLAHRSLNDRHDLGGGVLLVGAELREDLAREPRLVPVHRQDQQPPQRDRLGDGHRLTLRRRRFAHAQPGLGRCVRGRVAPPPDGRFERLHLQDRLQQRLGHVALGSVLALEREESDELLVVRIVRLLDDTEAVLLALEGRVVDGLDTAHAVLVDRRRSTPAVHQQHDGVASASGRLDRGYRPRAALDDELDDGYALLLREVALKLGAEDDLRPPRRPPLLAIVHKDEVRVVSVERRTFAARLAALVIGRLAALLAEGVSAVADAPR